MGRAPRIAIVWNHPSSLFHCSFRFEQYVEGFEKLGLEPVIVCSEESGRGFPAPLLTVQHPAALEDEEFWDSTGAEVVVAITWHRMTRMLGAARRAGARIVSIADTDGRVGLGSHPLATFQRSVAYAESPRDRLRHLYTWLKRMALEYRKGSPEDQEYLASTASSDAVILGNSRAKVEFSRFLERYGRPELDRRVHVVPFTVADPYLSARVADEKRDRVVAIGRWDDPQKDAPLLARALSIYLSQRPDTEVLLFGTEAPALRDLEGRFPSVRLMGIHPPERLVNYLSESRAIVFSSRWEGSPHAAFEAMAMGASIVAAPIPCFLSWCTDEGFGTVAPDRRPDSLARALHEEMEAWDAGERDGRAISAHWRSRLDPVQVCREMIEALDKSGTEAVH